MEQALNDTELVAAAECLDHSASLFNELRKTLRLDREVPHRAACERPAIACQTEEHLRKWMDRLKERLDSEKDSDSASDIAVVLSYLHKYYDKLIGHVIVLNTGQEPFVVQRTNNLSEHRFGRAKQGLRRKVGTKNLARFVQSMRPEELLVDNLLDAEYLQILCGGSLENLASSFAQNYPAGQRIRSERRQKTTSHPIPVRRKLIRQKGFFSKLKNAVAKAYQCAA